MIATSTAFDVVAESLRTRAEALARSHIARRRGGQALWRKAALLWPLFAKG